jgi:hypothetical protein
VRPSPRFPALGQPMGRESEGGNRVVAGVARWTSVQASPPDGTRARYLFLGGEEGPTGWPCPSGQPPTHTFQHALPPPTTTNNHHHFTYCYYCCCYYYCSYDYYYSEPFFVRPCPCPLGCSWTHNAAWAAVGPGCHTGDCSAACTSNHPASETWNYIACPVAPSRALPAELLFCPTHESGPC